MPILAAAEVRSGKLDDARAHIAEFIKQNPSWTIKVEANFPAGQQPSMVPELLGPYLDDLRKAGVPEG